MKPLRLALSAAALVLFPVVALRSPLIAFLLLITCAGAFLPAKFVLAEHRLGVNTITLSGLTEILFKSRDIVAAEPCGGILSVMINSSPTGISLGGTVVSMKTGEPTLNTSYTPAMTIPAGDDQTITGDSLALDQVANVRIPLTGETTLQLINTVGVEAAFTQLFTQAMRKIRNAIETHTLDVGYKGSSRAVGTAGTTPFASSHALIPQAHQILKDNGCPEDGMISAVISTGAETNLKTLSHIYKVNESGGAEVLRRGVLIDIDGVMLKPSSGVASHTKGAGTGYDIVSAGEAIGQSTLTTEGGTVNTTGIKAGDCIALDTDTANVYVVKTGLTATSGDVTINEPGLRVAAVDASEITVGNSYTANLMFHQSAIELAMRPPAEPPRIINGASGDAAVASFTLFDPVAKLVFKASIYLGYGMNMVDITTFYKAKAWIPRFIATIRG